jgi:hypothetical protein
MVLYAYDLNGKLLWQQDLGILDAGWFYDPTISGSMEARRSFTRIW